jgi:hypothetical protein
MLDIKDLLDQAASPLAAGNFITPFRACIEALKTATHQEKRCLYAGLRDMINRHGSALTEAERTICQALLGDLKEQDPLDEERQEVLARLNALSLSPPEERAGRVNVLFVGERPFLGSPFGVVQALEVQAWPWGGEIRLDHRAGSADLYQSFYLACQVALRFLSQALTRQEFDLINSAILLNNYRIHGSFPHLRCPVKGESLGLGAAMVVLSCLLDVPIPSTVAFTGRIDLHGNLHPVGGIEAKLEAARDKGICRVFLPEGNRRDLSPTICSALNVHLVRTIGEVVEAVFNQAAIQKGVARLKEVQIPPEARQRHWRVAAPVSQEKATRVLLTVVGKSDPIGTLKDRHGKPIGEQAGPILTLCREVRPHFVYLFYTTGGENDFTDNMAKTKQFLEDSTGSVTPVPLHAELDPTDLSQLLPAFQAELVKILNAHSPNDTAFFVNASSGTPQMLIAWHLLAERRWLPSALLLQIRERRYVKEGESQIRPVVLPAG